MMHFINPVQFVRDIGWSRKFYEKRLGLKVLNDGAALEKTVYVGFRCLAYRVHFICKNIKSMQPI